MRTLRIWRVLVPTHCDIDSPMASTPANRTVPIVAPVHLLGLRAIGLLTLRESEVSQKSRPPKTATECSVFSSP